MARGKASGYQLTKADIPIVTGMSDRGDRDHDIAAWFGVNQGRIAEAKDGKFGAFPSAPQNSLPPRGPPGVKGKRLRASIGKAIDMLAAGKPDAAHGILDEACGRYDANET